MDHGVIYDIMVRHKWIYFLSLRLSDMFGSLHHYTTSLVYNIVFDLLSVHALISIHTFFNQKDNI